MLAAKRKPRAHAHTRTRSTHIIGQALPGQHALHDVHARGLGAVEALVLPDEGALEVPQALAQVQLQRTRAMCTHSFMAYDTLLFVDVRFIAYNKSPDNNNNRSVRGDAHTPPTHSRAAPRAPTHPPFPPPNLSCT